MHRPSVDEQSPELGDLLSPQIVALAARNLSSSRSTTYRELERVERIVMYSTPPSSRPFARSRARRVRSGRSAGSGSVELFQKTLGDLPAAMPGIITSRRITSGRSDRASSSLQGRQPPRARPSSRPSRLTRQSSLIGLVVETRTLVGEPPSSAPIPRFPLVSHAHRQLEHKAAAVLDV